MTAAAAAAAPQQQIVPLLPQLRAFARSLCGGDAALADDLVQDTVVLALRAWGQFDPGTNLRSWLLKILHNRFHSLKRRKHLTAEVARDDLEGLSWAPASQEKSLELAAFKRAFKALSPQHREVLVLVAVHGLPYYEEVARIVGCELGTVKSRTNRARTLLKQMLLGEGGAAKTGAAAANGARATPPRPRPRCAVAVAVAVARAGRDSPCRDHAATADRRRARGPTVVAGRGRAADHPRRDPADAVPRDRGPPAQGRPERGLHPSPAVVRGAPPGRPSPPPAEAARLRSADPVGRVNPPHGATAFGPAEVRVAVAGGAGRAWPAVAQVHRGPRTPGRWRAAARRKPS
jgi:RNA polymerase sigma-70 factor, ECF subfamily